jgi:hypothetical protein
MAQRVIAYPELAALKANHTSRGEGSPRIKRRWADVRRGVRSAGRSSNVPVQASATPARPQGTLPAPLHELARDGNTLRCVSCGKTAVKARWTNLAYGRCGGNARGAAVVTWTRVVHQVLEDHGQVRCTRCAGHVPAHRRNTFIGKQCPAWHAVAPEPGLGGGGGAGGEVPDWGAWVFALLGRRAAGGDHASSSKDSSHWIVGAGEW